MRRRRPPFALAATLAIFLLGTAAGTYAAFSSSASNTGSTFAAASDFIAPTVSSTVIAKQSGYTPGYIKQGGSFRVYANASDGGNPAAGINTVTANLNSLSTGNTAVTLTAGSYSVGGMSYGYRSGLVAANSVIAGGSFSYSLTSTDLFSSPNVRTQTGYSATVDNTAPSASDIQTANGGSTVGKAEQGDNITYTFSEPIDPESILAGWTGSSTNVVLRIDNAGSDILTIYNSANSTLLPFGTVVLNENYVSANRTFGATGTASTMVMSGSAIIVTLGNPSGATRSVNNNSTMIWTPSISPYDRAGNTSSPTVASESGPADREF